MRLSTNTIDVRGLRVRDAQDKIEDFCMASKREVGVWMDGWMDRYGSHCTVTMGSLTGLLLWLFLCMQGRRDVYILHGHGTGRI